MAMPAVKILKQLANPNVQDIRYATLYDNMLILGSQDAKIGVILTTFSFAHQREFAHSQGNRKLCKQVIDLP